MILVVEDENIARRALGMLLSAKGYDTATASSAEEALKIVQTKGPPDVALVDLNLPGMNGIDFIHILTQTDPSVSTVLMTASNSEKAQLDVMGKAKCSYLRKPLDFTQLLSLVGAKNGTVQ